MPKLKASADDISNVAKMIKFVLDSVENIVGEGENADNQHFLLFPQCFRKPSCLRSLEVGIVKELKCVKITYKRSWHMNTDM